MDINVARLIYFSPTGTTKAVVKAVAQGAGMSITEHVNLTLPDAHTLKLAAMHDELAIIGSPVYGGRVPTDAISRLQRLKGNDTPAVIVVAYGNRAYEDALIELRDLVRGAGFNPVAAGAFIGEHSYSSSATPVAAGRPDADDLRKARKFGTMIRVKIEKLRTLAEMPLLQVPGNFPYKARGTLSNISPVTENETCIKCGECASVCPTAAIAVKDSAVTDRGICIRCCACVKTCPTGARKMNDPRIKEFAVQLSRNCRERKDPETYF